MENKQGKFVVTEALKSANLCLKFTEIRFAAELHPDTLGKLKRSPDSLAAIKWSYF